MYGLWDTLLGQGIVGGHLSGAEMAGREAAGMGLRILKGTAPAKIPVATADNAYLFDWRELRRWGLDEDDLVKGSQVRYKNLTFFGIYKWYIIGFTLLAVLESVLLVILLVQRARRRRAERALQKAKDELELRVELRTADLQQANQRLVDEIGVRKKAEAALQVETRNLQRALSEIKTLSGMLPICASCKKYATTRAIGIKSKATSKSTRRRPSATRSARSAPKSFIPIWSETSRSTGGAPFGPNGTPDAGFCPRRMICSLKTP